jgi:hypothetical protein
MRDGLLGLILFLAHWIAPDNSRVRLSADFIGMDSKSAYQFECKMDIGWNRQMEQLVDAGIPLHFNILHYSSKEDSIQFKRTLNFDMIRFTYKFTDSTSQKTVTSSEYPLIQLALRDFCTWKITVPSGATLHRVEVQILPSRAEQLNRMVDMSRVWGRQKIIIQFIPQKEALHARDRREN